MKKRRTDILILVIFLAGLSLILYPTLSDWWNAHHQSRAVASYVEQVADLSAEENDRIFQEALAYNEKLASGYTHYILSDEETEEYNNTLDVTGSGIMGYIDIPKIDVKLPIYHGTDEAVLQIAIGHLPGSSLPVGGESSHCVVSGHTGLPSAILFTNLNKLVEGDRFTMTVMDRTLTYEVDQIRIVLPDELNELEIEEGQDYCTLVTCTPYGVNTHRLLVRGHRVENAADTIRVTADALQVDTKMVAGVIAVIIILICLIFFVGPGRRRVNDETEETI